MQSASAAKSDEREVARVVAALDGDHANRFFHRRVHHPYHASGKPLERGRSSLFSQPLRGHPARALEIQLKAAAQKILRTNAPQQQISVGNRGLLAPSVTNRARIST